MILVNYFLTGAYTMEYGDASGTALLDIRSRKWSKRILEAIDPDRNLLEALPGLIEADACAGRVTKQAALLLGIPEGVFVSSGGGDNMMGAIGTGTVQDGTLTMSLGTSGTIYGASDKPMVDPHGLLAAFCSSTGSWLPLLCTMNCTVASEVTRNLFSKGVKDFDAIAMTAPIGSNGVVMLPYFNGERTPNYPRGKGCLMGLGLDTMTEANISRAAMESSIFGLKLGLKSFQDLGYAPKEIRLIGGGSKSLVWRQMVADICGLPVIIPKITEAAALGGALQALWSFRRSQGEQVEIREIVAEHVSLETSSACFPVAEQVAAYQAAYELYTSYVRVVEPLFS
ncbi:MAG: hypothetical protein CVV52_18095 [Spirochaetae bacterium HGW-Spirochaetae-8]|nr:MAG: hypothetical protein CVV52_18095 [Spirochaetae bacterium HGW-Spirochaetae-8]